MDQTGILVLLAVVTALNTVVVLVLAVAMVRSKPAPAPPPISMTAPPAATPSSAGPDPLAGAISAFLTRSDGLFRAGGPPVQPGPPLTGAPPPPAAPLTEAPPPAPAQPWPVSPPVRYVASAPRTVARHPVVELRPAAPPPGAPVASRSRFAPPPPAVAVPPPTWASPPVAARPIVSAPVSPASSVSIWFVGRDPSRSVVEPATAARLAPVIGGLLRERTRAEDAVALEGRRRFIVTLPGTPIDGAAALTRRLAQSCDAWLGAEEPPLRLEFGMSEIPGTPGRPTSSLDRAAGPERRRPVPLDV
jgi:hypothetical protein